MTTRLSAGRVVTAVVAILVALVIQLSVLPEIAWHGVVADLVLLVVVAIGLAHGSESGLTLGFVGGLMLDLAPPADHLAGRWALALMVVGYLAGRVRQPARPSPTAVLATVAACSFIGTSLFALTGLVLQDPSVSTGELIRGILLALVWDLLLTPFVLPPVLAVFRRVDAELVPV